MEVTCRYNIYCISTYLHIYISTYLLSRWRPSWRPPRLSPASPGGRRRPGCWTVAWCGSCLSKYLNICISTISTPQGAAHGAASLPLLHAEFQRVQHGELHPLHNTIDTYPRVQVSYYTVTILQMAAIPLDEHISAILVAAQVTVQCSWLLPCPADCRLCSVCGGLRPVLGAGHEAGPEDAADGQSAPHDAG